MEHMLSVKLLRKVKSFNSHRLLLEGHGDEADGHTAAPAPTAFGVVLLACGEESPLPDIEATVEATALPITADTMLAAPRSPMEQ